MLLGGSVIVVVMGLLLYIFVNRYCRMVVCVPMMCIRCSYNNSCCKKTSMYCTFLIFFILYRLAIVARFLTSTNYI